MAILSTNTKRSSCRKLFEFTQGIGVDSRLCTQEVQVQKAWARGLGKLGILSSGEQKDVERILDEAWAQMENGRFEWKVEDEDIHMNLERYVTERAGALGKKMHFGRSRNDLIATTLRLFARDSLSWVEEGLLELVDALTERAEKDKDVLVPGLTHVQHGQPIRHGHVLAAHGWAFFRDLERLRQAKTGAMATLPLGAAALSGTTLDIDLSAIALELGFVSPSFNSYDSVGDRDFILEALNVFSLFGVHLSRLAEDCILWSSTAMGLVKLPAEWSTGSSIMPNKRNPDVPELTRAKAAHLIAAATNAHVLMKAVPTSYGSDLHELKSVYIRAIDECLACLSVLPSFIRGLEPNQKIASALLDRGHLLATEIADELVRAGLPFREAYGRVALLVEVAEQSGIQLQAIPEAKRKELISELSQAFFLGLTPEFAVERRTNQGGTSLKRTQEGIAELKRQVLAFRSIP